MHLSEAERSVVRGVAEVLRRRFGATQVRLFGSAVRGTMDAESDIDLFVVLPQVGPGILEQITDVCTEAGQKCDRVIFVVLYEDRELAGGPVAVSPLVQTAAREGVSV